MFCNYVVKGQLRNSTLGKNDRWRIKGQLKFVYHLDQCFSTFLGSQHLTLSENFWWYPYIGKLLVIFCELSKSNFSSKNCERVKTFFR